MKKLEEIDIDEIKNFLIKSYKVTTWKECIDKQQFGDCYKICKKILDKFPNVFNSMADLYINYSDIAKKKLNELGDNDEMWGNHFVLVRNKTLYDFGKGTNTINNIYLLTQYENMKDKYTIKLSNKERTYIIDKIKRY